MGVDTPALDDEGEYLFTFALNANPQTTQKRQIWVTKTSLELAKVARVGVLGGSPEAEKSLNKIGNLLVERHSPRGQYHLLAVLADAPAAKKAAFDTEAGYKDLAASNQDFHLPEEVLPLIQKGTPLLAWAQNDAVATNLATQLSQAGAFTYSGMVGKSRAPWMGAWYFNREHPIYAGMPANQALGVYYQVKGNGANGWLVSGSGVEVMTGYSRDHDRKVGAGTFSAKLGKGTILMHRVPSMQPVLQQRFCFNAVEWLLSS
jgi:hypothetical protein